MGYSENDFIMISALQHFVFCPRQCALIHTEQVWAESRLTAEGRIMHERVHGEGNESRGSIRISRGLPLRSLRLGLVGIADVVEFHRTNGKLWQPYPVEYKRGKPKPDHSDMIQLCAQSLCLEEMLSVAIPDGALFYGRTRQRYDVAFDENLRRETEQIVNHTRQLLFSEATPAPEYSKRCENCSIKGECMPKKTGKHSSARAYIRRMVADKT